MMALCSYLLCQHVPWFGSSQEVGDGALGQPENRLPEQPLRDAVLAQLFFHLKIKKRILVKSSTQLESNPLKKYKLVSNHPLNPHTHRRIKRKNL